MWNRVLFNLVIATEAIFANKIRAGLTALGIIFGVAAVIAMLAVGQGAQQEILEQIKLVGVNNIVVTPIVKKKEAPGEQVATAVGKATKEKFSPGLTLADALSIRQVVPGVRAVSPEVLIEANVIKDGLQRPGRLVGIEPQYFDIINFRVERGQTFSAHHLATGAQVCIIGRGVQAKFFSKEDPIGKFLKVGKHWLKVIGVMESRGVSDVAISNLGIRNYDQDIYAPVQTVLLRYTNRTVLTKAMIQQANSDQENNDGNKKKDQPVNYHQLDRLVVQMADTDQLNAAAEIIARMLERRHFKVPDYEITIPELLLKQQQRTKDIFNIVLGVIAGISLLVGGIGIMNIMLASVLERIKEIGLRISLGAKKQDIVLQFLCEATLISVAGGVTGIVLGVVLAQVIAQVAGIPTIIAPWSVFVSFFVAAAVGIIFGIVPARRASEQDPITSLRYE
jgi:putative ABC transport system permease protein